MIERAESGLLGGDSGGDDCRVALVPLGVMVREITHRVAVMVEVPVEMQATRPEVLTVACAGFERCPETRRSGLRLLRLQYKQTAPSCSVPPAGHVGLLGPIVIETSPAEVTLNPAVAEMEPDVAAVVARPVPELGASPLWPIIATNVAEEVRATVAVRFCVERPENVVAAA